MIKTAFSKDIWELKYRNNEESEEDFYKRIVVGIFDNISDEKDNAYKNILGDDYKDTYYEIFSNHLALTAGRGLYALGTNKKNQTLSNCFVLAIKNDSMDAIMEAVKKAATVMKAGGGIGYSFSVLRPKNSIIKSTGSKSTGVLSFMSIFNTTCGTIEAGGNRRGAQIGVLGVWHPEIKDFIVCKREGDKLPDKYKPYKNFNLSVYVSDDFIDAVKKDAPWDLIFPDTSYEKYNDEWDGNIKQWLEKGYPVEVYETLPARELWDLIMKSNYDFAEPGILFEDTINRNNTLWMSEYILATNPCVTGDTLISVADGRGAVPIKILAEEGKDIPVYCVDDNGKQTISIMRNPRITGYNKEIYEIKLDDANTVKCTGNHKFYVNDGNGNIIYKEAKDLVERDSLVVKSKFLTRKGKNTFYWHLFDGIHYGTNSEHCRIYDIYKGAIPEGYQIHHKDFNSLNNIPENLTILKKSDHLKLHMSGSKNPMRDKWWNNTTNEEKARYRKNMSKSTSGLKNGHAFKITNEELENIIREFIKSKGRLISRRDYQDYALANNLPSQGSDNKFRNIKDLISKLNIELGFSTEEIENDASLKRLAVRTAKFQKKTDLKVFLDLEKRQILVEKVCEGCGKVFNVQHSRREISFCSKICHRNSDKFKVGYKKGILKHKQNLAKKRNANKVVFDRLVNKYICENKILPTRKDLVAISKENALGDIRTLGVANIVEFFNSMFDRYGIDYTIQSFIKKPEKRQQLAEKLIENGLTYNHKIVSIKRIGNATVYNGTVDNYHNYAIVLGDFDLDKLKNSINIDEKVQVFEIITKNCGEEPLIDGASCNLSSVNLTQFILNPFEKNATFNFKEFKKVVKYMVVALDKILDQNHYPLESQAEVVKQKRLIGLGVTGLGDMFAMLKLKYSSLEALDLAEEIAKVMREEAYKIGVELSKNFGPFKEWNTFDAVQKIQFVESPFLSDLPEELKKDILKYGVRNSRYLTIAPTGTTSLVMDNVSGGVEPIFSIEYDRKVKRSSEETTVEAVRTYSWELYTSMFGEDSEVPDYFETTDDLRVNDHLNMQAMFQKYICASISKCLKKGTRILTNKGLLKIEDCGNALGEDMFDSPLDGLKVYCPDGKWRAVTAHYSGGEVSTKSITFANGALLEGALTHKLMTVDGWKTLEELTVGDYIKVKKDSYPVAPGGKRLPEIELHYNSKVVKVPEYMNAKLAKLLGMLIADGHLQESSGSVSLCEKNKVVGVKYVHLFKYCFGVEPKLLVDKRTNVNNWVFNSRSLVRWLRILIGYRCDDKFIPEEIMLGSAEEQLACLSGLTLDGYKVNNGKNEFTVFYEGKSEKVARDAFTILHSLGMTPYLGKKYVKTHKYYVYSIRVCGFKECVEKHKNSNLYQNQDKLVKIPFTEKEIKQLGKKAENSYARSWIHRKNKVCWASTLDNKGFTYDKDFYYIKVTDISNSFAEVFDIEVEESHDYLINGIVSHNTINVPVDYSFEDYKDIFIRAHSLGLKGCTTYRPNDIIGSVLSKSSDKVCADDNRPSSIMPNCAPKRPKEIPCDIIHTSIKGEMWTVLIGLLEDKPYEIFCGSTEDLYLPKSCKNGIVRKQGGGKYELEVVIRRSPVVYKDLAGILMDDDQKAMTRLLSLGLRHGVLPRYIVEQLKKSNGNITAFSTAISRVLSRYIGTYNLKAGENKCPSCGEESLIFSEGCIKCISCSYSRCG